MIVELHILQNFAPSCLNRDDTNSPKECEFGGYRRARISSQCIKKSIREYFKKELIASKLLTQDVLANRTKLLVKELIVNILKTGKELEETQNAVNKAIASMGLATKDNEKTQYLLFLGKQEVDAMVSIILAHWNEFSGPDTGSAKGKKEAKIVLPEISKELLKSMDGGKATDLALFGRMLADLPEKNIDAASQVAHAISTNKVNNEFDFYTAIDDLQPKAEAGAGMMGTIEFNSSCYYRYANVDLEQLKKNLGNDIELVNKSVEAFLIAAVNAIPTGKQTSMAAQNPPSFVFAVVRDSGMWSLANAFAKAVWPGNNGDLIQQSQIALVEYWNKLTKVYGDNGIKAKLALTLDNVDLKGLQIADSFDELLKKVQTAISEDC